MVALDGIWVNKLRSSLTILGIIIGVASVILVLTLGKGGQHKIMNELESMGSNVFVVYVNSPDGDYDRYKMTPEECKIMRDSIDGIKALVPVATAAPEVRSRRKKQNCTIVGTESGFNEVLNVTMIKGRFINQNDDAAARKVIVINEKMSEDLFGVGGDALGQVLTVDDTPVMVCGVFQNDSGMMEGAPRPVGYIPVNLYMEIYPNSGIYELEGSAVTKDQVEKVAQKVLKSLENRHDVVGKKAYMVFNMEQEMQSANNVMNIITLVISAIAGISLLVGGIGVMNIMLVSVTERTREIGIRMAIGAKRRDVMVQFLIEAVVLSLLGGVIGVLLGLGGGGIICMIAKIPFTVSIGTILLAFVFSSVVGIFFGMYPANRAAKLDPIEALRYE